MPGFGTRGWGAGEWSVTDDVAAFSCGSSFPGLNNPGKLK